MPDEPIRVLIVTGTPHRVAELDGILTGAGLQTRAVSDSMSAQGILEIWRPAVAIVDLRFPSDESRRFCADVTERPDAQAPPLVLVAEGPNLLKASAVIPAALVAAPIDPDYLVAAVRRVARETGGAAGTTAFAR
jgi:CheY-like chemotaxis protein